VWKKEVPAGGREMSRIFAVLSQLVGLISKMPQAMAFYFLKTHHVTPLDRASDASEVSLSIQATTSMNVISPHRKTSPARLSFTTSQTSV
jgi:hypothetical protein